MENQNQGPSNPQQVNQQFTEQFGQIPLPNATAVLVLGIISIPVCFCYFLFGIPGLVLGIISIVLSNKAKKLYAENPSLYTQVSYNNLKAGRICAIIGLCLNAILFLVMILYAVFAVTFLTGLFSSMPFK